MLCALAAYLATTSAGPLLLAGAAILALLLAARAAWRVPLVAQAVMLVMGGYVLLNRNFAELHVSLSGLPVYVGEILLAVALPWSLSRWPARLSRPDALFFIVLAAWLAYATLRLLAGGLATGLDAVRDFAIAYYALFALVGYVAWSAVPRAAWTTVFLVVFIGLLGVVAVTAVQGPIGLPIPGDDPTSPTKADRADVMSVSLIAAATFFLLALRKAGLALPRLLLSSAALALLLPLEVRAATIGVVAIVVLLAFQQRWRTLLSLVGLPVIVIALVAVFGVQFRGRSGGGSTDALLARQLSTVSVLWGGQAVEAASTGDYWTQDPAVDTVAWRLAFWNALVNDIGSSGQGVLFGLGFGTDLTGSVGFQPDPNAPRPLRSPHNFLLTLVGRTGLVGLGLWLTLLVTWLVPAFRATRATLQAGRDEEADYLLWLLVYALAIVLAALFGVVLESPFGAIPCYLLFGMSLRASAEAMAHAAARAQVRLSRAPPALAEATA